MYATSLDFMQFGILINIFENQHSQSDTGGWDMRLMLFNAILDQVCFVEWKCEGALCME